MGQHKTNPNSILKKQGLLKPKEKVSKLSTEEIMQMIFKKAFDISQFYNQSDTTDGLYLLDYDGEIINYNRKD